MIKIVFFEARRNSFSFLLPFLLALAPRAFSQMDQGSIVGTVLDATGAVVPNAKVKLVNQQNGFTLERTADASGSYTFTPIKIGVYTLTASGERFRSFEQQGVNVTAGSRIEVPLTLESLRQTSRSR